MIIGIEASHANKKARTGVEEYCFQIIQALKKTIPETEQVVLYSNSKLEGELGVLPPNWKVKVLHWPLRKLWTQIRLSLHFLFHKPQVFFSPGQLIPYFTPKQTITMVHDCAFLVYPGAYKFLGRQYLKWMNKRIIKDSAILLTSSEFNRKELTKYYGLRASKKISVVPLSGGTFPEIDGFDPSKYGIKKPYILFIGRIETKKNTRQLVQAFTVAKQTSDIQLVLVGKPGVGYHAIKKEIDRSPYKEDILTLGYVDRTVISGLLKKTVGFIFPSIYEGFGLPVLEAMAMGAPVIAADIESLKEVGGNAAIYVDPWDTKAFADAILHLSTDSGEQIRYSHEGKERASLFSWEKTAKSTWELIQSLDPKKIV